MARHFKVRAVAGSVFEQRDSAIYNMTPVINPEGEVVTCYRKMFPVKPCEVGIAAGNEFCVFDVPQVGRFGLPSVTTFGFPKLHGP